MTSLFPLRLYLQQGSGSQHMCWGWEHKHSVHSSNKSIFLPTVNVFVPLKTKSPDLTERKAIVGMARLQEHPRDPIP